MTTLPQGPDADPNRDLFEELWPLRATAEDVADLAVWARSRIAQCRRDELKFGRSRSKGRASTQQVPQALVEAWTERMTLQRVLRFLRGER